MSFTSYFFVPSWREICLKEIIANYHFSNCGQGIKSPRWNIWPWNSEWLSLCARSKGSEGRFVNWNNKVDSSFPRRWSPRRWTFLLLPAMSRPQMQIISSLQFCEKKKTAVVVTLKKHLIINPHWFREMAKPQKTFLPLLKCPQPTSLSPYSQTWLSKVPEGQLESVPCLQKSHPNRTAANQTQPRCFLLFTLKTSLSFEHPWTPAEMKGQGMGAPATSLWKISLG